LAGLVGNCQSYAPQAICRENILPVSHDHQFPDLFGKNIQSIMNQPYKAELLMAFSSSSTDST
jgi:hypothetical protein